MKKMLLLAAGVALVHWLNKAEQEAIDRHVKLPRLPVRDAGKLEVEKLEVDWQAGTPSDALAARAVVVRQGTGW